MKAKYILRFDDIHYQMNWKIWKEVEEILVNYQIKPILAVIPENKDEKLIKDYSISENEFWKKINYYHSLGWTIAMHGYQHEYSSKNSGDFIKINNYSEFAGLLEKIQEKKIIKGREIFVKNGIIPKVFVAPAHTFDKTTVKILLKYGFEIISDGFFLYPRIRYNLIWVPQQLWWFKKFPFGCFTVCLHPNYWQKEHLERFKKEIKLFREKIVSLQEALKIFPPKKFNFFDKIMENFLNFRLKAYNKNNSKN